MKVILAVLMLFGVLALMVFGPFWGKDKPATPQVPPDAFVQECMGDAPKSVSNPMRYCLCLWGEGVHNPSHAFTKMDGQAAARACASRVGPSAPSTIQQVREELQRPAGQPLKLITEEQPPR